jgi:hypothetical protein
LFSAGESTKVERSYPSDFLFAPTALTKSNAIVWLNSVLKGVDFTDVLVEGDCYRARSLSSFATRVYVDTAAKGSNLSRVELLKIWYATQHRMFQSLAKEIKERCNVLLFSSLTFSSPHLFVWFCSGVDPSQQAGFDRHKGHQCLCAVINGSLLSNWSCSSSQKYACLRFFILSLSSILLLFVRLWLYLVHSRV